MLYDQIIIMKLALDGFMTFLYFLRKTCELYVIFTNYIGHNIMRWVSIKTPYNSRELKTEIIIIMVMIFII